MRMIGSYLLGNQIIVIIFIFMLPQNLYELQMRVLEASNSSVKRNALTLCKNYQYCMVYDSDVYFLQ